MAYNLARVIEVVALIEKSLELLGRLPGKPESVEVKPRAGEGVGVVEAPRGLLIHHYATDEKGVLKG